MFRKFLSLLGIFVLILLAIYLILPVPQFPSDPPGTLLSTEPADTESIYRRAYYSNQSRSEVIGYYRQTFAPSYVFLPFSQIRLNHPPEFAYELIRDQTRSSWLEELVHPLKDSIYINGYYPTKPTDQININGVHYIAKITVRYIPSHYLARLTGLLLAAVCTAWLIREYSHV